MCSKSWYKRSDSDFRWKNKSKEDNKKINFSLEARKMKVKLNLKWKKI